MLISAPLSTAPTHCIPSMLRISEIKLPLDHSEDDLTATILERLNISADKLHSFKVFKRSHDARKKSRILLIYQVDVVLDKEAETELLAKSPALPRVGPSPDTNYKFVTAPVAQFPESKQRPIVVGFGPCGILAALVLAQMGRKPRGLERGQEGR